MARFGSNIKRALNSSKSLKERAVTLRSCTMNLSHIAKMPRSVIIEKLKHETKIDLHFIQNEAEVLIAAEWLREFRRKIEHSTI